MEFLDVLDDAGEKAETIKDYYTVHKSGLWHRTVHVWLLNPENELLLQKRSANRRTYPGYWDISAAGHVSAGQKSLEAAVRETQEELGIILPEECFEYLFTIKEDEVLNHGAYLNKEFQDVYLVRVESNNMKITLSPEEVEDVRWVKLDELKDIIRDKRDRIVPHDREYSMLLKLLKNRM